MHHSRTRLRAEFASTEQSLTCSVPPALADAWRGRVLLDRYRLTEPVGTGGSGVVFAAEDRLSGALVAVKLLLPQPHLTINVSRLLLEAEIGHDIAHPHLVGLSDMGEDHGTAFLVMELLEGMTLAQLLQERGRLDAATTLSLLGPVIAAVAHVHEHGVLHRDIKPENVYLVQRPECEDLTPKLIDFGIAKRLMERSCTRDGAVLGTPGYMSPEQALAEPLTYATDVWSLGVVLFECLSGRLPFEAPSLTGLLLKLVTSDAPPLATVAPHVPYALAQVVDQALLRDPAQRHESARAFRTALEKALTIRPSAKEASHRHMVRARHRQKTWMAYAKT